MFKSTITFWLLIFSFSLSIAQTPTPATPAPPKPKRKYIPVDWKHYNANPNYKPVTMKSGVTGNVSSLMMAMPASRAILPKDSVIKIADNIWVLCGNFYYPVVIETPKGLIVCPSGEHDGEGAFFRKIIRQKISKKPIIAILMDHAHYSKGSVGLLDGDKAMIVAHPQHNEVMRVSGELSNPNIEEMLPIMDAKARIHFSTDHPKTGPDAPIAGDGGTLELNQKRGWLPATKTLKDGETIVIGGVTIQAFHAMTDTEETLTFWLPKEKLIIDNVMWTMIPNLYTLRGDKYRSPENWMSAVKKIRDLQPEKLISVGGGGMPLNGKQTIQDACNALYNAMAFIYDQSIRMTNLGIQPDELRHYIKFPESLSGHPYVNEIYGEVNTFYQAFPVYNGGYFSGYAEDIHTLPRKVMAEKMIALAGGADKILEQYKQAIEKSEFIWAKELAKNLYYSDKTNPVYRKNLADVFRALGQRSPSLIVRNFYTAGALSLEGNPNFTLNSIQSKEWVEKDISRAINHLRTRLNPDLANGTEGVLVFKVGGKTSAGLHIRQAIAEFVPDPSKHYKAADATIETSADDFAAYFRGEKSAADFLKASKTTGDAAKFLGTFDEYKFRTLYSAEEKVKMN